MPTLFTPMRNNISFFSSGNLEAILKLLADSKIITHKKKKPSN